MWPAALQQGILRTAAANTRATTVVNLRDPADSAAQYCTIGGTVVLATQAQLSAFDRAAEPVYRLLESDAATKSNIDKIRDLKAANGTQARSDPACAAASPTVASAPSAVPANAPTTFPEGIYRTELHKARIPWSGRVILVMTPACGGDINGSVLFSAAWTLDGRP